MRFRLSKNPENAQSALALPLGELSRGSVTERVIEYLHRKYSIFPIFIENREALSDLAALGHLSQRERQVAVFDKLKGVLQHFATRPKYMSSFDSLRSRRQAL